MSLNVTNLEAFSNEYWDNTTGYGWTTFIAVLICIVIFSYELLGNEHRFFGFFDDFTFKFVSRSCINTSLFLVFLFLGQLSRDYYLLEKMTGKKPGIFPVNKHTQINSIKKDLLRKQLDNRRLIEADIIQAALINHKLHTMFPSYSADDFIKMLINFLFHPESKSRITTLLGALLVLVTSILIIKISDIQMIQALIINAMENPSFYFSSWLILSLAAFLSVVLFLQFFALFRVVIFKLATSKSHKLNHLINDIIKYSSIENILISRY